MQIHAKEKKHALCVHGADFAVLRIIYPCFSENEKINAFYEKLCENLLEFFRSDANALKEEYELLPRRPRRYTPALCMNMFYTISYADDTIVSIVREYVLKNESKLLCYRRSCEIWDLKEEVLLPAKKFFKGRAARLAEKNEFYFDGSPVLVENFFPTAISSNGRRLKLSDYVRETRFQK